LAADYEKQTEQDKATYDVVKAQTLKDAEEKHKAAVELKGRLSRLVPFFTEFRSDLHERRRDEFESRRRDAERELDRQITARKREVRERRLREKREREEKERQIREAEEAAAREREEKQRLEEAKREELARLREQRARESEEAREKAALQLRREEEALARRKEEKERARAQAERPEPFAAASGAGRPPLKLPGAGKWREREAVKAGEGAAAPSRAAPPMERTDSRERVGAAPRLNLAGSGNKPSWRDRQREREAGGRDDSSSRAGPRVPSGAGGYRMDRTDSGRGANGRNESPAAPAGEPIRPSGAPGKWVPPHKRT
jgi:translation initiation factor 3 subunit A